MFSGKVRCQTCALVRVGLQLSSQPFCSPPSLESVFIMSTPPHSLGPNAQRRYYPVASNASSTASLLPPSYQDMPRRQSPTNLAPPQGSGFHPSSARPKNAPPTLRSSASNSSLVSSVYRRLHCQALGYNVFPHNAYSTLSFRMTLVDMLPLSQTPIHRPLYPRYLTRCGPLFGCQRRSDVERSHSFRWHLIPTSGGRTYLLTSQNLMTICTILTPGETERTIQEERCSRTGD